MLNLSVRWMALGGQASTQRPHPLHSSRSTRRFPRSLLWGSVIWCSFPASGGLHQHALRFALEVVGAHGKILQILLEAGIGNGDEGFGALPQRLAMQVGDAVLRNDIVNVGARSNDACARLQHGHNARNGSMKSG